jgi:hypothetical protein
MRTVPGWGVLTSAAAPVLLIGGWTLAARLQPGHFDQVSGTISALAADDAAYRWVMTAALTGVGLAHIGTAAALHPATPAARALLATGGVATVLVAANPLPADGGPAPAHALAAGVAFTALALWPALSWRRRTTNASGAADARGTTGATQAAHATHTTDGTDAGRPPVETGPGDAAAAEPQPVPFRPGVALAASGVLLGVLGWFFTELLQDTGRVGLSERAAAGSQALWPLAAVLLARRSRRGSVPG